MKYLVQILKAIKDFLTPKDPIEEYMSQATDHADCSRRAKDVNRFRGMFWG